MAFTHTSRFPNLICSFQPEKPHISGSNRRITPARDKVIDFGKYKGKMLGALPSTYLKWVSKNLRTGDSIHWAILADQVLEDPVYQDRLEWEFADTVLNGNMNSSSPVRNENAVSRLVEVSERFGWDNEDKIGWSRVNFELLGTSKGGRIPRLAAAPLSSGGEEVRAEGRRLSESEMRRKDRRERAKLKKGEDKMGELGIVRKYGDGIVNMRSNRVQNEKKEDRLDPEDSNRFPGREGLFKKVLNNK